MRSRHNPACRPLLAVFAAVLLSSCASRALSQSTPQVLKLPDPTPREVDPHLLYPNDPSVPPATRRALAAQEQKRRELILWAANELVVLSERAQQEASVPPEAASKAALATNVARIEALARNLAAAMKAP